MLNRTGASRRSGVGADDLSFQFDSLFMKLDQLERKLERRTEETIDREFGASFRTVIMMDTELGQVAKGIWRVQKRIDHFLKRDRTEKGEAGEQANGSRKGNHVHAEQPIFLN